MKEVLIMKKKSNPIASIGAALVVITVFVAAKHMMKKYGQGRI